MWRQCGGRMPMVHRCRIWPHAAGVSPLSCNLNPESCDLIPGFPPPWFRYTFGSLCSEILRLACGRLRTSSTDVGMSSQPITRVWKPASHFGLFLLAYSLQLAAQSCKLTRTNALPQFHLSRRDWYQRIIESQSVQTYTGVRRSRAFACADEIAFSYCRWCA